MNDFVDKDPGWFGIALPCIVIASLFILLLAIIGIVTVCNLLFHSTGVF